MTIREAFFATLREVLRQSDVAALVVLAALAYGFYYPAPYAHQRAREVPMAVVDEEASALTRRLVAAIEASDGAAVVASPPDLNAGQDLLRRRAVEAVLVIPRGVTRAALRGEGPRLALWVDGVYLVRAKSIGSAVETALLGTLEDMAGPYLGARDPMPPVVAVARFNASGGYANYIFPAVTPVILQQTLLFGVAVLLALRRRTGRPAFPSGPELAGGWLAFAALSALASLFYFGWFFALQDLPRTAGIAVLVVLAVVQAAAMAAFACAIGSLFVSMESALLLLIPTSLPVFFLTGATWPQAAMPGWVAALGQALPATHAARALLLADQMGAPFAAVLEPLAKLAVLALLYYLAAWAQMRRACQASPRAQ